MRSTESYHVTTVLDGPRTRCEVRDGHRQVVATFKGEHAYGKARRLLRQLEDTSSPPVRPASRQRAA